MGQYRQWLHYREADQQLHTQLETLKQELAQLHEQARLLKEPDYGTGNAIIQALSTYLRAEEYLKNSLDTPNEQGSTNGQSSTLEDFIIEDIPSSATVAEFVPETVSQALFAWSRLPNFDTQGVREPTITASTHTPLPPMLPTPPPTTHPGINLLPEDLAAFMDEHTQTPGQRTLPLWIRNTFYSSSSSSPVDQQSLRTNRLVERWLERWRREEKDAQMVQEDSVE